MIHVSYKTNASRMLFLLLTTISWAVGENAINLQSTHPSKGLAENELSSNFNDMEQCQAVCIDIFFLLPEHPLAMSACQRGCRMYNIIYLRDDRSLNNSKDECYSSCEDAYVEYTALKSACQKGCKNMLRKKQTELEAVVVYIEQDTRNFDSPPPEIDELEMNWLIENYTPKELAYIDNQHSYKIPESMYRTLPIETLIEELVKPPQSRPAGDWLDCASRNSGIPKWILVAAIISAILVALYLSISSEKKVIGDDMLLGEEEKAECNGHQAGPLPTKTPFLKDNVIEIDTTQSPEGNAVLPIGVGNVDSASKQEHDVLFSAPLKKYSAESEKV